MSRSKDRAPRVPDRPSPSPAELLRMLGLPDHGADWAALLAADCSLFEADENTCLMQEDECHDHLVGLLEGKVDIYRAFGQASIPIARREAPLLLGESALVPGRSRSATVMARTKVLACRIPADGFHLAMEQCPEVGIQVLKGLLGRLREHEDRYLEKLRYHLRPPRTVATSATMAAADATPTAPKGVWDSLLPLVQRARALARSDLSLLINGETGTGKELLAEFVHAASGRARGPFVALNCAAVPDTMVEAELFGVHKGAATGVDERVGLLREAHGGTLFLDEVGELTLSTQAKLLRALQTKRFRAVGGSQEVKSDVRLVCATSRDLWQESQTDPPRFRADLYQRIHGSRLVIPPLRERRSDVPVLARFFAARRLSPGESAEYVLRDVMARLLTYDWPGNIRELQQTLSESLVIADAHWHECDRLQPEDLRVELREAIPSRIGSADVRRTASAEQDVVDLSESVAGTLRNRSLNAYVRDEQVRLITKALEANAWVKKDAARDLGMSPQALANRMKRLGMR